MVATRTGFASMVLAPNLCSMVRGNSWAIDGIATAMATAAKTMREAGAFMVKPLKMRSGCGAMQEIDEDRDTDDCGEEPGGYLDGREQRAAEKIGGGDQECAAQGRQHGVKPKAGARDAAGRMGSDQANEADG